MAKARAIIKRLKAIRNIRKITRTMELVATARFKKAMERAVEAASYTRKLGEIVADVSASLKAAGNSGSGKSSGESFSHPLLQAHSETKKAVVLVLTSNRGLCGGFNAGILRVGTARLRELQAATVQIEGGQVDLEVAGKRGINYYKFQKLAYTRSYTNFEDKPGFDEVNELADRYIAAYIRGELDRLDVAFMQFHSMSKQKPIVETLLPIAKLETADTAFKSKTAAETGAEPVAYEFLPSPQEILEEIVPASFKAKLFKCFLDAAVSEQVARMVAMKSATENADGMLRSLKQEYNRARQSQITSELAEIIGGAAALE